jgi:hypothetical protein
MSVIARIPGRPRLLPTERLGLGVVMQGGHGQCRSIILANAYIKLLGLRLHTVYSYLPLAENPESTGGTDES